MNDPASRPAPTAETFDALGAGHLPAHLGIAIATVAGRELRAHMPVQPCLMAPNGFLHAGSIVTLADTACGYGCVANLPDGATGFTTVELKSNFFGTTRDGHVDCVATLLHGGRATQVWDATVTHRESGRTLAVFRCTQMLLYPR
ncbi:thioesterase [Rubrivivax gelatinosus]|nr:thioesterase [Rubrivivax gelatinosus]